MKARVTAITPELEKYLKGDSSADLPADLVGALKDKDREEKIDVR